MRAEARVHAQRPRPRDMHPWLGVAHFDDRNLQVLALSDRPPRANTRPPMSSTCAAVIARRLGEPDQTLRGVSSMRERSGSGILLRRAPPRSFSPV
jgi:hypothetical protein